MIHYIKYPQEIIEIRENIIRSLSLVHQLNDVLRKRNKSKLYQVLDQMQQEIFPLEKSNIDIPKCN